MDLRRLETVVASKTNHRPVSWPIGAAVGGSVTQWSAMQRQRDKRTLRAVYLVAGGLTVVLLLLLVRVALLATRPAAPIAEMIGGQAGQSTIAGRRGNLVDREGRLLATADVAWRLFVDPKLVVDPQSFAEQVGAALDCDPAAIRQAIAQRPNSRFIVIDPQVDDDRLTRLRDLRISGLSKQMYLKRRYPMGALAGQVIGFVGADGYGLEGAEAKYEAQLVGQAGRMRYARDASDRPVWLAGEYQSAQPGRAVRLSLDAAIQSIAEQQLAEVCQKYEAGSAQLIVMDPATGEILAMANYPSFDPGAIDGSSVDHRRNRCVTDVFEPGSTFKPFVWIAATQAGLADTAEIIDCHEGFYRSPKGRVLRDAHGYGDLTWAEVLIRSSNIGMSIVGQRMGERRLHDAVVAFGFGRKTGSGLPGEVPGVVRPVDKWTHYSVTSVPMGHEIGVTALQMVTALAAIANDGLAVTPRILALDHRTDPAMAEPIYERVLPPSACQLARQVMRRVVTEGTGSRANSDRYAVFGKTGTAQVADRKNGGYLEGAYMSAFIGGAPVDRPRIVVGCFVHKPNPKKGYYGGTVAAPVVKQVIEQTLDYLGVPPTVDPISAMTPVAARQ